MENASLVKSEASNRHADVERLLARIFEDAGWKVSHEPDGPNGYRPDLLIRRPGASYLVELKVGVEGRSDRLIPLWSQACLQASSASGKHAPLAIVAAPRIAPRVAENILKFAERFAPNAAAGVIDLAGLRLFRGPQLESLNVEAPAKPRMASHGPKEQAHLFSDLNQWMIKVLLAPELPDELLGAPRGQYRNASQLAKAAHVSVMSAFRFVEQLKRDGYLHESSSYLKLVRRDSLFRQWQAASLRRANEVSMRFLLRGNDSRSALKRMLDSGRACLGLFAAADALGFGFVQGVPPHVYVRRLSSAGLAAWKNLVPVAPGEVPDVLVRQASSPESIFRGIVRPNGLVSCDILQAWLDVSGHPSRGEEQANLIRKRVLDRLMRGNEHG
jgi:hypothetical protein